MIITCPTDPVGRECFDKIQTMHDSPTFGSQSVSLAREVPQFLRPDQQLHEVNVSSPTIAREGDNDSAPLTMSSTRRLSSDIDPCRSELKKSPSIVRGFSSSHISSSFRSQGNPNLAEATTRSNHSPPKKRSRVFTLGGSFRDGDERSFEECMASQSSRHDTAESGSANSEARHLSLREKTASFSDELPLCAIRHRSSPCSSDQGAIERNDEGSESTFEDDEEFEWEESVTESGRSSGDEQGQHFQRVDSQPTLVSRQSMLTMMVNQPWRRQGNTFRPSPVLQGSCLNSPKCLSISASPPENVRENSTVDGSNVPRSKAIIVKSSPTSPVVDSPRAIRRRMLATELTGSDRRHLLWERQQRNPTINACLKRRHTANDLKILQEYTRPKGTHKEMSPIESGDGPESNAESQAKYKDISNLGSWTSYTADYGPWEYHVRGW